MRIGLISDTHIPEAGLELPPRVYEVFAGVDLVLHAGDIYTLDVLDWLQRHGPVYAALGNGDEGGAGRIPTPPDPRVKPSHVLSLEGVTVGLVHSFPLPEEIPWISFQEMMRRKFEQPVDLIVCGDTHVARIDTSDGVLMVNPGSATLPNNLTARPGTVGILELGSAGPVAHIIDLAAPPHS